MELKMHGSDIDSYMADFDRLISEVGHSQHDIGVLQKFKEGLQPSLLREVLTHVVPAPTTLAAWKQRARERQTVYKELKNAGLHQRSHGGGPNPIQQKLAQRLGLHNYRTPAQRAAIPAFRPQYSPASQNNNWRNQVVPMDVDAGSVSQNTYKGSSPLTDAERAELMAKRACFRCRKPGHLSRNCLGRRGPERVNAGVTAPEPPRRESGPQPLLASFGGLKGLHDHLAEHGTEAEKEAFIDACKDF